jgi:hypothetical protein
MPEAVGSGLKGGATFLSHNAPQAGIGLHSLSLSLLKQISFDPFGFSGIRWKNTAPVDD